MSLEPSHGDSFAWSMVPRRFRTNRLAQTLMVVLSTGRTDPTKADRFGGMAAYIARFARLETMRGYYQRKEDNV